MQQKDIDELIKRYRANQCTAEEVLFLESWFAQWNDKTPFDLPAEQLAEDLQLISENVLPLHHETKQVRLWTRIAAAASILIAVSIGGYVFLKPTTEQQYVAAYKRNDIAPGTNKAVLILGNGVKIDLTAAKNGKVVEQIIKTADGQLRYSGSLADAGFNTLSTPNGGKYDVVLGDGTRVWLNSASSIKYPASFAHLKERIVELSGEAYFEVVHNSNVPFKVVTANLTVEDIGTHFNVNAYEAGSKTTLLQGSVKINNSQVLVPGQQAVVLPEGIKVTQADTEEAVAWKNGYFRFNNENIKSIMLKLARWYDIEVVYASDVSAEGFYGTISRNKNISEVLTMLQQTQGVHFKIEGRRVTVLE
jgi:hypothetical protein